MARRGGGFRRTKTPMIDRKVSVVDYYDPALRSANTWAEREALASAVIAERQKQEQKFEAIAGVYKTADSIITGESISVKVGDFSNMTKNSKAPAFNDGKTIYLNMNNLLDLSDETITSLNGVNYHEIAHLLWSPRAGTSLVKAVVKEGLLGVMNVLEDMRIESLLVTRYPTVRESLTASVLAYLIDTAGEDLHNAFASLRGRTYLPLELRQACADMFIQQYGLDKTKAVASVIDEYRTLVLNNSADGDRALELIREYARLLGLDPDTSNADGEGEGESNESGEQGSNSPSKIAGLSSCFEREPMQSGRPESAKKQTQTVQRMQQNDKANGSETLEGTPAESNDKSDSKSDNTSKPSNPNVGGSSSEQSDYDPANDRESVDNPLAEQMRKALENVMRSPSIKRETNQVRQAIRSVDTVESIISKANYSEVVADTAMLAIARDFGNELIQLQVDNDPSWLRETPSGKLNVQRTMNMDINDINILFDRWGTGNDNYDIEAVIITDNSGSMDRLMGEACTANWIIKKAIESIDGNVSSYIFDDNTFNLYSADERATRSIRMVSANGSTDPSEALLEAERILSASKRKTKLLFVITDGQWGSATLAEDTIKRINAIEGAITNLVYISNLYEWQADWTFEQIAGEHRHNCMNMSMVNKPREIVDVARNLVRSLSMV